MRVFEPRGVKASVPRTSIVAWRLRRPTPGSILEPMRWLGLVLALSCSACLRSAAERACDGATDGDACSFAGVAGACASGVCEPFGCGNGRVDPGEACDNGADMNGPGTGCSKDCLSNETCGNGVLDTATSEECDDGNSLSHDGCSSGCGFEAPTWVQIGHVPLPRANAMMTYDAALDVGVMMGGETPLVGVTFSDVWQWNGAWQPGIVGLAPPARTHGALVYDERAHTTILFGGDGGTGTAALFNDLWIWDGHSWTPGPIDPRVVPRAGMAAVYDGKRGRIVMAAGGFNGTSLDTWAWANGTWTMLCDPCGYRGRFAPAAAYDPKRDVVVMFGGTTTPNTFLGDTWEFDGTTWKEIKPPTSPAARGEAAMAYDATLGAIVMSGGVDASGALDDVWLWSGTTWTPGPKLPIGRQGHAMASDPRRGHVLAFGGFTSVTLTNTMLRFTGTTWESLTQVDPPMLVNAAAAYEPFTQRSVMVGGFDGKSAVAQDFEFDGAWRQKSDAPMPARSSAAIAADMRGALVLFGGKDEKGGFFDDTWLWRAGTWTAAQPAQKPLQRSHHMMAFDGTRVVVLGGATIGPPFDDMWGWNGTTWSQIITTLPPSRSSGAMAFDPIRRKVVLFGGENQSGAKEMIYADTWEWDGDAWHEIATPVSPQARVGATLTWDAARRKLVLFGGLAASGNVNLDDTWEYDGASWSIVEQPAQLRPFARHDHVMVSDAHGGFGMTGGLLGNAPETWRFQWSTRTREETCVRALDLDGDGRAGCADDDCWSVCRPACQPGTAADCLATTPHCGDGTCSALESCRICPEDCGACAPICGDFVCDPGETNCPGDCP
jgi:cysteine-rich repeat protein